MKPQETLVWHLVLGLALASLLSLLFWLTSRTPSGYRVMLIVFNFLFVLSTFPLEGLLVMKLSLLIVADFLGFVWSWLAWVLSVQICVSFGEGFSTVYVILNSFLTLMLVITFWSVSLTILRRTSDKRT